MLIQPINEEKNGGHVEKSFEFSNRPDTG